MFNRFVLAFRRERLFAVVNEDVVGALNRADFANVAPVTLLPADFRAIVHFVAVRGVVVICRFAAVTIQQARLAELGVFVPEFRRGGPAVHHFLAHAAPLRIQFVVEQLVGGVTAADDGATADRREFTIGTGQSVDVTAQNLHDARRLAGAHCALAGLQVVQQRKVWPQRLSIGRGVAQTTHGTGDARAFYNAAAYLRAV